MNNNVTDWEEYKALLNFQNTENIKNCIEKLKKSSQNYHKPTSLKKLG